MAYKKVTAHERFKENPFVEKAIEDIRLVKRMQIVTPKDRNEIQMIVSQSGDVEGHTAFLKYVEVDEDKFAKLYLSQLASFWELSKPAIRVFSYILSILKPKQDSFILRMDESLKYTGYKNRKDVNNGLAALIESKIIARSKYEFEYFINPLVVFNGDRVTFAKAYIKKRKEKGDMTNSQLDLFPSTGASIRAFLNEKSEEV
jgi:hypothetical protein